MKLGVICDGISRDLSHAVDVMDEFGLEYAELQFVGDTEVGDHSKQEIADIDTLLRDRGKPVSCLSRHIFAGMTAANRPGDELHTKHMDALKRVIEMAHVVGSPLVRAAAAAGKIGGKTHAEIIRRIARSEVKKKDDVIAQAYHLANGRLRHRLSLNLRAHSRYSCKRKPPSPSPSSS